MPSTHWTVTVGDKPTSAIVDPASGGAERPTLVLGHGAGTRMDHRTMQRLAETLTASGLHVVRFNFLYSEERRNPPDRLPQLMACFAAVAQRARDELRSEQLFLGGHSMGGRAASHLAAEGTVCDGLILLSYPLHPADKPAALRAAHLPAIHVPVLCLNGTRDALCYPDHMQPVADALAPVWTMHWLSGADHGYHVLARPGRTEDDVFEEIGRTVRNWLGAI